MANMAFEEIWEQTSIWPIRIQLLDRAGYTLWASSEASDFVLTIDRCFLLCRTRQALRTTVLSEVQFNLSSLEGFPDFRRSLIQSRGTDSKLAVYRSFHCQRAYARLMEPDWRNWSMHTCNEVLNCLNLLDDIAKSIHDEKAIDEFSRNSSVVRLMDTLTFLDQASRTALGALDTEAVRLAFSSAARRIAANCLVIC